MSITGLKSSCHFLWRLQGRSHSLPLPASGAAGIPFLVATSLQSLLSWSHYPLLFCTCGKSPSASPTRTIEMTFRVDQITYNNLSISRSLIASEKNPFSLKGGSQWFQGLGPNTLASMLQLPSGSFKSIYVNTQIRISRSPPGVLGHLRLHSPPPSHLSTELQVPGFAAV